MTQMNNILIEGISKSFGEKGEIKALQDIHLQIDEGTLFGLIGPDGAGKTTLFRILTTLLIPDTGQAKVMGYDVVQDFKKIRNHVGYMPGKFSLYQDLSVEENLNFFATLFKTTVKENYHLIEDIYVQLEPFKKRRAGALSGGMKQKLALCCALVHEPKVLFLDEPTTGVDAVSRKEFWEMLKKLKKEGITILVSTPYMDEATLCDEIALIQEGKILSVSTPEKLVSDSTMVLYGIKANQMFSLYKTLKTHAKVLSCHSFGTYHHVQFRGSTNIQALEQQLLNEGHLGLEIIKIQPTVEDIFMDFMTEEVHA